VLSTGAYYFWKNEISVKVETVDMRQRQLEISGQEILTRDKTGLRVNFIAQFKVVDIEKAVIDNKDYEKQLYILAQLALREFIGTYTLDELLEKKEAISIYVMKALKDKSGALGVQISDCGVRDIILPGEVKDIMNKVLIAQKQAQANVIMRREETASTRSLLNTARLMEDNEMLFKLKEMEFVEKIADKIGEITVAGNGQVIDQLKSLFTPVK
jgi:regulator of protease activity HflC (stomatin/prohibitin superfamily)